MVCNKLADVAKRLVDNEMTVLHDDERACSCSKKATAGSVLRNGKPSPAASYKTRADSHETAQGVVLVKRRTLLKLRASPRQKIK